MFLVRPGRNMIFPKDIDLSARNWCHDHDFAKRQSMSELVLFWRKHETCREFPFLTFRQAQRNIWGQGGFFIYFCQIKLHRGSLHNATFGAGKKSNFSQIRFR